MTYVRPHIIIYKQKSLILNLTPLYSVSLASPPIIYSQLQLQLQLSQQLIFTELIVQK